MENSVYLTDLNNAGIRAVATRADKAGYAILEFEEFQKEQDKNIDDALKNTNFKMPKTVSELLTQLKGLI